MTTPSLCESYSVRLLDILIRPFADHAQYLFPKTLLIFLSCRLFSFEVYTIIFFS